MISDRIRLLEQQCTQRGREMPPAHFEIDYHHAALTRFADCPLWEKTARAMAYAIVNQDVIICDDDRIGGRVYVTEDQQSIAIGKQGQNVRLASKLTGFDIDIELQKAAAKKKKKNVEDSLLSAIEESNEEIDTPTEDSTEQVEDAAKKATESALGETSEE